MSSLATVAALVGIAASAIIYGTDIFSALVLRPAAVGAADASVADLIGRIHEYGDRRLPVPGAVSVIAAALAAAASHNTAARIAGATAFAALLAWLAIYVRVSAPINKQLRAAAATHTGPRTRDNSSNGGTASSGPAPPCRPSRCPECSSGTLPTLRCWCTASPTLGG